MNKIYNTEIKHLSDGDYAIIKSMCKYSAMVFNHVVTFITSHYKENRDMPSVDLITSSVSRKWPYKALHEDSVSYIVSSVHEEYCRYFEVYRTWNKSREKSRRPSPPRIKKGGSCFQLVYNTFDFTPDGKIRLPGIMSKVSFSYPPSVREEELLSVKIVFRHDPVYFDMFFEARNKEASLVDLVDSRVLTIDLGVNNFITAFVNFNNCFFSVRGKYLKKVLTDYSSLLASIQKDEDELKYNYEKEAKRISSNELELEALRASYVSELNKINRSKYRIVRKKRNRVKDFMHKASSLIRDYMVKYKIKKCVVGYNPGWKVDTKVCSLSHTVFQRTPYKKFLFLLKYKVEEIGGEFIERCEDFTSKASALDCDPIDLPIAFSGKRLKDTSKYQASTGEILDADINGVVNIYRIYSNDFSLDKDRRKAMLRPSIKITADELTKGLYCLV